MRLTIFIVLFLVISGCAHKKPVPAAVTAAQIKRICTVWEKGRYKYKPGDPERSDSRSTINYIRRNNTARKAFCDAPKSNAE